MKCQRKLPIYIFQDGSCNWPIKTDACADCPHLTGTPQPAVITFAQLTSELKAALWEWAKAGFPVADERVIARRRALCVACPEWDGAARLGAGKCGKCGCTQFKFWLETEKCPLRKWDL